MKATLEAIRKHNPCADSWEKLLKSLGKTEADNEPLELTYILETLGIDDAIWALRSLEGKDKEIRLFTADCAESVLPIFEKEYPNDDRPRKAIKATRDYANELINIEKLKDVSDAASDAAWDAWDAAKAAWAARNASKGAVCPAITVARNARNAEKQKQEELFIKYFG